MEMLKEFKEWLAQRKKKDGKYISASSVYKYARAINTISNEMIKNGVIKKSLLSISNADELENHINQIKLHKDFNNKNNTGHNMYSVALDHYFNFISNKHE